MDQDSEVRAFGQKQRGHAVDVVERNAWAQKQIIEDILDVSRVITGKLQLQTGAVDLVFVINAALEAVTPAIEAKGHQGRNQLSAKDAYHFGRRRSIATGSLESAFECVKVYAGWWKDNCQRR